jgi:hypothetical protein
LKELYAVDPIRRLIGREGEEAATAAGPEVVAREAGIVKLEKA